MFCKGRQRSGLNKASTAYVKGQTHLQQETESESCLHLPTDSEEMWLPQRDLLQESHLDDKNITATMLEIGFSKTENNSQLSYKQDQT